ncbi:LOW QUALITY PROTEIN: hypothetical protein BC937DRAFT_90045 [Endogone sp. FLAS-F59071]|nr:LOW QUALITY PROTEIN: hypothetical protein BC937DRAFT_90045 [Endogone sp. FLAS-F59071]|eukprot:RUS22189.1 LOW QUALITY PROTEIN: hypothetical protein BC937DRAFT_90045 [Endogone sp. FLAS-F59071]
MTATYPTNIPARGYYYIDTQAPSQPWLPEHGYASRCKSKGAHGSSYPAASPRPPRPRAVGLAVSSEYGRRRLNESRKEVYHTSILPSSAIWLAL